MQNFKFFNTLQEYREYIMREVIPSEEFKCNTFYRGLIEFVIQHRAPIFFEQTKDFEFSHFTQYANFVLDRKGYYQNDLVRSMYILHDFMHMIFRNPLRAREISFKEFCEILNINEWVASNETEIMTYFRILNMRSKSLPYRVMYDLLIDAGYTQKPTPRQLLDLRRDVLFEHETSLTRTLSAEKGADEVFAYLRKFKENNKAWCELWYNNFPRPADVHTAFPYEDEEVYAPVLGYEMFLEQFSINGPYNTQENYEHNIYKNVCNLVHLTQSTDVPLPRFFADCEETLRRLEGRIIMPEVAKEFHTTYIKNKKVGTGATN